MSKSAKKALVRAITLEKSKLVSLNMVNRCILGRSQMGLYMVEFDLDLQGHLGSKLSKSAKNRLVRIITLVALKLGSLNLAIRSILGISQMGLYMVGFDFDLQGHSGSKLAKNGLVSTITFKELKLWSPNLNIKCNIS